MNLVVNKGLESAVASLNDPYSHYFDPSDYQSFQNEDNPHLTGIGVDVQPNPRGLEIVEVFPGSPAAKAGLGHGDLITAVGGNVARRTAPPSRLGADQGPGGQQGDTHDRLATASGTWSRSRARTWSCRSRRGASSTTTASKLGYLQFTSFTQGSGDELRAQVHKVLSQGAQGLILDLRENGGGLLDEAVNVASIFIADGTIVSTRGRNQPTRCTSRRATRSRRRSRWSCSSTAAPRRRRRSSPGR